jgi:predicted ABC-type transport system involved in lysophospholipase L1 biosynthesis ATPase subunit
VVASDNDWYVEILKLYQISAESHQSIARALYARKKLAIFDDVLSSLDRNTEDQVFARVFGPHGLLRQHGVTAVLTTNRGKRVPSSFSRKKAHLFQRNGCHLVPRS